VKASAGWVVALSLALRCGEAEGIEAQPPMGWNSYDAYGTTIDEQQFRANALWMSRHLKRFGWHYLIIDMGWYVLNPTPSGNAPGAMVALDSYGRYTPAPNRFPSAADGAGFAPLAAYVHSLGLGFGIHILRGIPGEAVKRNMPIADSPYRAADAVDPNAACPWNPDNTGLDAGKPAAQAYYNSIAALYAISPVWMPAPNNCSPIWRFSQLIRTAAMCGSSTARVSWSCGGRQPAQVPQNMSPFSI
jgi:alpha-galactosidase